MIQKLIFKNEVKEILLDYILKGDVKPGDRLSLPSIAEVLDVSVTPIREALTQLSETGIVTYIANRGFFVTELSVKQAKEIYELMMILEGNAVEKSTFDKVQLSELVQINKNLIKATKAIDILKFDREFHQKLIENYDNVSAIKIIETLRVRISLYEYAFWSEEQKQDSIDMHNDIIKALKANKVSTAVNLVKKNWLLSEHAIEKLEPSKSSKR